MSANRFFLEKPQRLVEAEDKTVECEHEWQKFRQSVVPDNPEYKAFNKTHYFVVRGCPKCKKKEYLQYIVEA